MSLRRSIRKAERGLTNEDRQLYERDLEHYQKKPLIAYLLLIFLGTLGAHKFYLNKIGAGLLYPALSLIGWILNVGTGLSIIGGILDPDIISSYGIYATIGLLAWLAFLGITIYDIITLPNQIEHRNYGVRINLLGDYDYIEVPSDNIIRNRIISYIPVLAVAVFCIGLLVYKQNSSVSPTVSSEQPMSTSALPTKSDKNLEIKDGKDQSNQRWSMYVGFIRFGYSHIPTDIGNSIYSNSVHVNYQFQNVSSKTLTGIRFKARLIDSFGRTISEFAPSGEYNVKSGSFTSFTDYWEFEDNEFEEDEPYDNLVDSVSAKTLKSEISVTALSFSDGTTINFSEDNWRTPKFILPL